MSEPLLLEELVVPITIDYLEEDQIYQVSCPWLQGCHAWGETLDEAIRSIPDNIRTMIDARRTKGAPLPSQLENLSPSQSFTLRMVPA